MLLAVHAAFAVLSSLALWRALQQPWLADSVAEPSAAAVLRATLPLASLAGSMLVVWAGSALGSRRRALALDAASWGIAVLAVLFLSLGPATRDLTGIILVAVVAIRLAPAAAAVVQGHAPRRLAFAVAFVAYASLAGWLTVAADPYGDQVHYLLAADRLAHGSLDATIDAPLFRSLIGLDPSGSDVATHVVAAPAGPRTVQGYAVPLLLLPGWLLAGRLGAMLVVALAAAWASVQTAALLRETAPARVVGPAWALATFLPPALPIAYHLYPNAIGAALIATAYRLLFTASIRRPAIAGALLGATLLLTPRDALALVVLALFARERRFFAGVAAMAILAALVDLVAYGVPVPFAGYLYGTAAAQQLTAEPSLTFRFWVGLPAMLFDRTFGLAGSAPWLLLAPLGIAAALRADRRLLPAALTIGASLAALSLYRYWEGGYAPPGRYFVEVLPLAAPFAAYGLALARGRIARAAVILAVVLSAMATLVFAAVPTRALNSAYQQQLQDAFDAVLGVNPIGWLPSFQPTSADWYVGAYLRLVPAVALVGAAIWLGMKTPRRSGGASKPAAVAPG